MSTVWRRHMKLITLADWHIRSTVPRTRKDEYHEAQFRKIRQLVAWSNEYKASILCPGDMLDSNRITFSTYNDLQRELQKTELTIFAIRGNHDSYFHTDDVSGTPLQGLADAGAIWLAEGSTPLDENTTLYQYGWDHEPQAPTTPGYNILMVHKSVFKKEIPFWFEGKEAYTPESFKEKYPGFDLYLAGDIHEPFVKDNVVVSGSMMRMNTTQKDYRPRAYLIDTITKDINPLYFTIEEDVFYEELTTVKDEGYSETLEGLVNALKKSAENKTDFKSDCLALANDIDVNLTLKEIFNHVEKN